MLVKGCKNWFLFYIDLFYLHQISNILGGGSVFCVVFCFVFSNILQK